MTWPTSAAVFRGDEREGGLVEEVGEVVELLRDAGDVVALGHRMRCGGLRGDRRPSRPRGATADHAAASERRLAREQRSELRGLEQLAATSVVEPELGEDRGRLGVPRESRLPPFAGEPLAQLEVARASSGRHAGRRAAGETVPFQRFSSSRNATS